MTKEKRESIDSFAELIRKPFPLDTFSNITEVVKQLCGEVLEAEFNEELTKGKIYKLTCDEVKKQNLLFKIEYKKGLSEEDKNFTIAHELGHLFIHMGFLFNSKKWENTKNYQDSPIYRRGYSEEESEADEFARVILMPDADFNKAINELKHNNNTLKLKDLADKFFVPVQEALTRGQLIGRFSR